jgi:hypothetical protein
MPLLSCVLMGATGRMIKDLNGNPMVKIIALASLGVFTLLLVLSLVLSIVGLAAIPSHGRQGLLGRSLCGLLLSGLVLLLIATNFISGRREAIRARTLDRSPSTTATDRNGSENNRNHSVPQPPIAPNAAAGHPLLAKAIDAQNKKLQAIIKDYLAASKGLQDPFILEMNGVTRREQLAARKELLKKFIAANDKWMAFLETDERTLRENLESLKVPRASVDMAMKQYHQAIASTQDVQLNIRETDRRLGVALMGMLGVLEQNWGQWNYNATRKKVDFNQPAMLDKYLKFRDDMEAAAHEQKNWVTKLNATRNS